MKYRSNHNKIYFFHMALFLEIFNSSISRADQYYTINWGSNPPIFFSNTSGNASTQYGFSSSPDGASTFTLSGKAAASTFLATSLENSSFQFSGGQGFTVSKNDYRFSNNFNLIIHATFNSQLQVGGISALSPYAAAQTLATAAVSGTGVSMSTGIISLNYSASGSATTPISMPPFLSLTNGTGVVDTQYELSATYSGYAISQGWADASVSAANGNFADLVITLEAVSQ